MDAITHQHATVDNAQAIHQSTRLFHGSSRLSRSFTPSAHHGQSDEPYWLFATASMNVALRYGHAFSASTSIPFALPRISVLDWLHGKAVPEHSFIISASPDHPDFPVDTYVLDAREPWVVALDFAPLTAQEQALFADQHATALPCDTW